MSDSDVADGVEPPTGREQRTAGHPTRSAGLVSAVTYSDTGVHAGVSTGIEGYSSVTASMTVSTAGELFENARYSVAR